MDDDSLDELVDRNLGPAGHPSLSPADLASDAGELPRCLHPSAPSWQSAAVLL